MSKPHFFTNKEQVHGEVSVWAFPRTEWEREQAAKEGDHSPFKYNLIIGAPYEDDATKVCTDIITIQVPSGIDLLAKTIETLKEKKEQTRKIANSQIADLEEKINGLLMLAAPKNISGNKPIINLVDPDDCYGADTVDERMNDMPF